MYCKNCGNNIPDNVSFCSKCGVHVIQNDTSKNLIEKKKKIIIIVSVLFSIMIAVVAIVVCLANNTNSTNENNNVDSFNDSSEDDFVDNNQLNEVIANYNDNIENDYNEQIENNVINDDSDDIVENDNHEDVDAKDTNEEIIELKNSDSYFINAVCNEYGQKDSKDFFGLAFMNANDTIQLLDRSKTIAIYTAYDSVSFVPVISDAKYTVGYDFENGIDYDTEHIKVSDFPDIITGGISGIQGQLSPYSSYGFSELTSPGHPIQECNGMLLENFMAENSKEYFVRSSGYYYSHLYIEAEPNATFTFGGYIGTEWVEEELKADVEFYEIDGAITIVPEKTKNGYFTLDCSELDSGLYYVIEFDTFVEIV